MAMSTKNSVSQDNDRNLETYSLIWLDSEVKQTENYVDIQTQLRKLIHHLRIFDESDQCESYIRSIPKEDRIVFIVNDKIGKEFIARIHSLEQIFSIYIYGSNEKQIRDWSKTYQKVKGISTKLNSLVDQIQSSQITKRIRNRVDEMLSIKVFNASSSEEKSTTGLNGQFLCSQLLIDRLLCMKPKPTDQHDLMDLCKKFYKESSSELNIIQEFENDYSSDRALWWYTRESFLYRLLNKALRMQDIDLLFLFRFFIRDLHDQLKAFQLSMPIRVYRGQVISNDELQALKSSVGQFVSMNSFLSTSLDRQLAVSFLNSATLSNEVQRILFEIDLDPTREGIRPFADITEHSFFTDEQEVLIMLGSIFRLNNIECQDRIWIAHMTLCSDNDSSLKAIFDYAKNEYDENDSGSIDMSFGILLFKMGEYNRAEKYYNRLVNELPQGDPHLAPCYHNLGMIDNHRGKYDSSLQWLNRALKLYQQARQSDDPLIATEHNSIGEVYFRKGNRADAIASFNKGLAIRKKAFGEDHLQVAMSYHNLGNAYQEEKKFQEAFECHQKSLMIRQKHLPPNHSDIGSSLHCIASIYLCIGYADLALEYYNKALSVYQKTLSPQHSDIAMVHYNLGLLYAGKNEFVQALENYKKAATIFRATLPPTHPFIAAVDQNIQGVSNMLT